MVTMDSNLKDKFLVLREDFPILKEQVYGHPLVYLDNAATTQKPRKVVETMAHEYYTQNANVHRGVHWLSQRATELHEASRESVRRFIGAESTSEIIFTRGTTEGINLVATCFGQQFMKTDDEVIISEMEHHSNIVPWQLLKSRSGVNFRIVPINDKGELELDAFEQLFNEHTKLVSLVHVSNVLGTVNPIKHIIEIAHNHGVPVLVDAAQSVPHMPINVQELDADFLVFSGHKIYGPTGVGVLYGKRKWLEQMPPYQGGGEMIGHVSFEGTTFNELPFKFEAGTPDFVGTSGLMAALDYVSGIGMEQIAAYEESLTQHALTQLRQIPRIRVFGESEHHGAVISFQVGEIHHFDMGTLLDRLGIAVRTGHHCAQPLMHRLGVEGTVRASFSFYNTFAEVDELVAGIKRVSKMF